eukprot:TRINITY_DN19163_c0_g1_i1.p1 TRINITY_DN19163_c0_g1~~TRINITY_DN19163_c0_g1_i1.p1  ORF type:complete len:179 (-),score=27.32 TRINITY_DN19163_c0_g1_i1:295-831(-)
MAAARQCEICQAHCPVNLMAWLGQTSSESDRRSRAEVRDCVEEWLTKVDPRASAMYSRQDLQAILFSIAENIHKDSDVFESRTSDLGNRCVKWLGETREDSVKHGTTHAGMMVLKPRAEETTWAWVNRILILLFAPEADFNQYMQLPKEPFKMRCGDQMCVNMSHIACGIYTNNQPHE